MSENLKCLLCKCENNTEFHEIFDEIGNEFQLSKLIEQHFDIEVQCLNENERKQQVLCDECINRTIDLYDLDEYSKEGQQQESPSQVEYVNDVNEIRLTAFDTAIDDGAVVTEHQTVVESEAEKYSNKDTDGNDYEQFPYNSSVDIPNEDANNVDYFEKYYNDECEGLIDENCATSTDEAEEKIEDAELPAEVIGNINEVDVAIDIDDYLNETINSNLHELQFDWNAACQSCDLQIETFQELLSHIEFEHCNDDKQYECIISECKENFTNISLLVRHLILQHAPLASLQIYGACIDCGFRFSNFTHFNKHSCFRKLKRRAGLRNYCKLCELDFCSFKRYTFHLQFHMAKRRPKVCFVCRCFFGDIEEFFEHVQYKHEHEETLACVFCDRIFKDKQIYETHKGTHTAHLKYKCSYCPKGYSHKHLLNKHIEVCHNKQPLQFQCNVCDKWYTLKTTLDKHMETHMLETEVQVYVCSNCGIIARENDDLAEHIESSESYCHLANIKQEILSLAYTCEFCSMDFKSISDLSAHHNTAVHMDNMYECPSCKNRYNDYRKLSNHLKTHNNFKAWQRSLPLNRLFACTVKDCCKTFPQWINLHKHKKHTHIQHNCSTCSEIFQSKQELQVHMDSCQQEKIEFKCQFCAKICQTKMSLAVHVARSHNNKNINCPICKGAYKNEQALQQHIDFVHTPVQCQYCNKSIINKRNLQIHERNVHKNERRYFCQICDKGFFHKNEMLSHEKYVHPDMIYSCEQCQFTTNYAKSLDIHMAMHNKQFEFKCPYCPREFVRKQVYELHLKRHEVQKQFVCAQRIEGGCSASFVSNYLLNMHIKRKHAHSDASADDVDEPNSSKRGRRQTPDITTNHLDAFDANDYITTDETTPDFNELILEEQIDSLVSNQNFFLT